MELIHKYSLNGYNIVIDVNGGAVHVIDDVTYRVLDFYKEIGLEDIIKTLEGEFEADKKTWKKRDYCIQRMSTSSILVL